MSKLSYSVCLLLILLQVLSVGAQDYLTKGGREVYTVLAGFPVRYSSIFIDPLCFLFNLDNSYGGWCSYVNDLQQWVQISSINPELWIAVVTQGKPVHEQRVLEYYVTYSIDGFTWSILENGRIFKGNTDSTTKIRNNFEKGIQARAIRIHPTKWNHHMSMRFDGIIYV